MRLLALLVLASLQGCGPPEGERRSIEDEWREGVAKCEGDEVYSDDEWVKEGAFTHYDSDGKVSAKGAYQNGVETGAWEEWHEDGTHAVGRYVDGARDGPWTYNHEGGAKQEEGRYRAGRREGEWLWWYSDGRLRSKAMYAGGKLNGLTTNYRLDGSVEEATSGQYEDGVRVSD